MSVASFCLRALGVAGTTALGSLPIAIIGDMKDTHMGMCISVAAGMMVGCSMVLAIESLIASSFIAVAVSVLCGCLMIHAIEWIIGGREDLTFGDLKGSNAAAGLVIFFSMLVHSIGEGLSIGVSAIHAEVNEQNTGLNLVVLASLATHNIPEGMAICMAFRSKGMSIRRASWYAFMSNLPQPMSALPAYLLMQRFATCSELIVPLGLGLAAGAMFYVVFKELLPEALEKVSANRALPVMTASGILVLLLDAYSHFGPEHISETIPTSRRGFQLEL